MEGEKTNKNQNMKLRRILRSCLINALIFSEGKQVVKAPGHQDLSIQSHAFLDETSVKI